ncbi:MAG: hypothetical protein SFV54_09835 [Bryobacteraceae bacterium]|nr:hypothetical protein [Bryobacteraceae bacterium]
MTRRTVITAAAASGAAAMLYAQGDKGMYTELLNQSMKEKKGLMFYIGGQTVGGLVVRIDGDQAVEVRNQQYGRIIIRLASVDAVAMP